MTTLTKVIQTLLSTLYHHLDEPPYQRDVFNEHIADSERITIHIDKEEGGLSITATDSNDVDMEFYFVDHWVDVVLVTIECLLVDTYVVNNATDVALDIFVSKAEAMGVTEWLDTPAVLLFSEDNKFTYTPENPNSNGNPIELIIDPDTIDYSDVVEFIQCTMEQYL